MQRILNFVKKQKRTNNYKFMCFSTNSNRNREQKSEEWNYNGSFYNSILLLPILSIIDRKVEPTKRCFFFSSSSQKINQIENRISSIEYPANKPIEDRYDFQQIVDSQNKPIGYIVNIFDGHGGWQVAEYCQKHLSAEFQKIIA